MAARNNGGATGKSKPPVEHQFKPGNPGRPKGSRNKLGEAFIEAMHADFVEHGAKVIEQVRVEKPDQYLKVVASILPKQLEIKDSLFDGVSDDQLAAIVAAATSALGIADEREGGTGTTYQ